MRGQLYLSPSEIEIEQIPLEEVIRKKEWFELIDTHELCGLEEMGCKIHLEKEATLIENSGTDLVFLNRVTNLNMSEEMLSDFLDVIPPKFSFVINPFTLPSNAIQILEKYGYRNSISSTVVGSEVPLDLESPAHDYELVDVKIDNADFDDMFSVFSTFFLKPNEAQIVGRNRLAGNLNRGTHILVRQKGMPIGMVGTIDNNGISGIYCGIVLPEFRASNILSVLAFELSQRVLAKGINRYYGKSRNRAFLFGLKRMFKFEHLYNEKTFILDSTNT